MPTELKAMVFDLDGTLYVNASLGREIRRSACRYIARLRCLTVEEADFLINETKQRLSTDSGMDTPLSRACQELGGNLRDLHRHFAAEIDPEPFLTRDERVVELLKSLGRKFELYIYTNNNYSITAAIMGSIGIGGLFRQVFTIEDTWIPKPDQGALADILRRIGRKPGECMFVGDRFDVDLRFPAELGCAVFLVGTTKDLFPLLQINE